MSPVRHSTERADPIGVFDSGIGGLSVLQALRATLPDEDFVYVADSAYTPYGERSDALITERTLAIAEHLRDAHRAKLLVVACNTASAAAAHALRHDNPGWPVVAIEPALKPAALLSRTGHVGVLATRSTLASRKFGALRQAVNASHPAIRFTEKACDGLASAIEQWALSGDGDPSRALLDRYLGEIGPLGEAPGAIDTLVLGCTHYPLIRAHIAQRAAPGLTLVEAGPPVARHALRLLHATGLLRTAAPLDSVPIPASTPAPAQPSGQLRLLATGETATLQAAAQQWLAHVQTAPTAVAV